MTRASKGPSLAQSIVQGDRGALARAISAVENGDPDAEPVLRALFPRTGRVPIVGVAGPLGVGKSSLINALVSRLRTQGKTVGIVAVDPSSPFSGGSVLGDRIRLERPAGDDGVFFRSMASRGAAGGVAATTREVVRLLEAGGFDVLLVETVGSGQVDIAIRDIATTRVIVLVPHLGDEVQTLKAGLFEIADVFCVNKSDLPGAEHAEKDLADMVTLGPSPEGWKPRIVRTSSVVPSGIDELWQAIEAHEEFLNRSEARREGERHRLSREIVERAGQRLAAELSDRLERDPTLRRLLDRVVDRRLDPRTAADRLLAASIRRR
jgi:LAO/AO transport system kinase